MHSKCSSGHCTGFSAGNTFRYFTWLSVQSRNKGRVGEKRGEKKKTRLICFASKPYLILFLTALMFQKAIILGPNPRGNDTFIKIFHQGTEKMITCMIKVEKPQISTFPPGCPCNITVYLYLFTPFVT